MNTAQAQPSPSSERQSRAGRAVVIVMLILMGPIVVHDSMTATGSGWLTSAALTAIHGYQRFLSPWMPVRCRFKPSCSHYGYEAIRKYGIVVGSAKTAWRILRCNPFTKFGTEDLP